MKTPLSRLSWLASATTWLIASGCTGQIIGGVEPPPPAPGVVADVGPPLRSPGARRLTREEVARSLQRLLGADVPVDVTLLPAENLTPFDNDVLEQSPSLLVVESMESIAGDVATWATGAPDRLSRLLPCAPAGAMDAGCFAQFIQGFGRRVLRRPLAAEEVTEIGGLLDYARDSGRFSDAVAMAVRFLLMHPEFIYRVEPGTPVGGGRVRLSGFETASRMSFLLQGTTPDDALLTAAGDGTLDSAAGRRLQAERLLASKEGKEQIRRFHAFWLGYSRLDSLPIQQKLRAETDALIDRVTGPGHDFRDLLLADQTHIDAELAGHYGLTGASSAFGWVGYGEAPRRGILSHGLFAAAGAKFSDTSPTRRGKFIRERFLCQPVQLPPPTVNVDVDLPPASRTPDACKIDRYQEHRDNAECASCHALVDPIGFGLENFDELGRYRTHDKGRPECVIEGTGTFDDATRFRGARELAAILSASPDFVPCMAEYFIRFAAGRKADDGDEKRAQWLALEMEATGQSFASLMLAYVAHPNFGYREE